MQSGISASQDLQNAFRTLTNSPSQRALFATIENESLLPGITIPLRGDSLSSDLEQLAPHLSPTRATYILLKTDPSAAAADGYTAVTFVPNAAPVRQKMLFASTRLTLVRELGIERFRDTVFCTEVDELTPAGWARHEASEGVAAPLTTEEQGLQGVKAAEAREAQGTGGRRGHVSGAVDVATADGVLDALRWLREEGCRGTLVQLKYTLPDETLQLDSSTDSVSPGEVAGSISSQEPRYSFYSHPAAAADAEAVILFIYTCPSSSRIRERMVYSTGKSWTRTVAERDAGIVITRSLEATEPSELTEEVLGEGLTSRSAGVGAVSNGDNASRSSTPGAGASGFARPKRPGRR